MIYLVGLPGNNQIEIGKVLSNEFGYEFVDASMLFERAYNKSMLDFLKVDNVHNFWGLISLSLTTYEKLNDGIDMCVSIPQGIPIVESFIDYMKKRGMIFYIQNNNWLDNIKDTYKSYYIFKDITDDEYTAACRIIEKNQHKKFKEMCDFTLIK